MISERSFSKYRPLWLGGVALLVLPFAKNGNIAAAERRFLAD